MSEGCVLETPLKRKPRVQNNEAVTFFYDL